LLIALLFSGARARLSAQERGPGMESRAELSAMLDSLRTRTAVGDDQAQERTRERIAAIERRLRVGDFLPGDVVGLDVSGQPSWTGSFPVQQDQMLELPELDPIPLAGVLYSEVEATIRDALAEVLRTPRVKVHPLMRVAVVGEVGAPGFYDVPPSTFLSDLITAAGGPTNAARMDKVALRRQGKTIAEGQQLSYGGLTLRDAGVLGGDEFYIPARGTGFMGGVRNFSILLGTVATITLIATRP